MYRRDCVGLKGLDKEENVSRLKDSEKNINTLRYNSQRKEDIELEIDKDCLY